MPCSGCIVVFYALSGRVAERLSHLVYLDAFVPMNGESVLDFLPEDAREALLARAARDGDGWRLPPHDDELPYGVTDPADARWVRGKLTSQPVRAFSQPVRLANPAASALPRTFVNCVAEEWFGEFAARVRSDPSWRYRELPTGHDAMITMPRELADLLLEVA